MKNGKKNNVKIGTLRPHPSKEGALAGSMYCLGLSLIPISLEPQTSKDGKKYFRIFAEDWYEIGAAFPREKDGMVYHSVSIDSPILPAPINAALFPDREDGGFNLVWNRQDESREPKAEATVNVNVQPQQLTETQTKISSRRPTDSRLAL